MLIGHFGAGLRLVTAIVATIASGRLLVLGYLPNPRWVSTRPPWLFRVLAVLLLGVSMALFLSLLPAV